MTETSVMTLWQLLIDKLGTDDNDSEDLVSFKISPWYDFGNRRLQVDFEIVTTKPEVSIATFGSSVGVDVSSRIPSSLDGGELSQSWKAGRYRGFIIAADVPAENKTRTGAVAVGAFVLLQSGTYVFTWRSERFLYHT